MELFTTFLFSMPDIICRKIPSGTILVMHNMVGFKIYGDLSLKRYQDKNLNISFHTILEENIFLVVLKQTPFYWMQIKFWNLSQYQCCSQFYIFNIINFMWNLNTPLSEVDTAIWAWSVE